MENTFDGLNRSRSDPFRPIDLTVEIVDAAAGSQKSRTAVRISVEKAKTENRKTIHSSPTLELTKEKIAFAKECNPTVKIYEITRDPNRPQYKKSIGGVARRICDFIETRAAGGGLLLFITHEGFNRVAVWPEQTKEFDLIIDEAPQVDLTRQPFNLRYSHWVLTNFLNTDPVPTTLAERNSKRKPPPEFTYVDKDDKDTSKKTDESRLFTYQLMLQPGSGSSDAEIDVALREGKRLLQKRNEWEAWLKEDSNTRIHGEAKTYYLVTAQEDSGLEDPLQWIKLRQNGVDVDDIYKYLDPVPRWLLQGAALFTDMSAWNAMIIKPDPENPVDDRGLVTIIGFRRPDMLKSFNKVTMMGALFTHTMTYMVWKQLGVKFVPSREIDINASTTHLSKRRLNIYWLYDEGWSKYTKDLSGGIEPVLELIKSSKVIAADAEVCVVLNKEDGGPEKPDVIYKTFRNAIPMPHNSKGQNRFRQYHQLIHLAALNAYTRDIQWLESVLGIDADQQRIARTGQEIYQTAMRTSLREPSSNHDVDIVVADKSVAEWLVQWFEPIEQVSVFEIDSTGVIRRKSKRGPKPTGKAFTQVERNRRYREKKKLETQDQ